MTNDMIISVSFILFMTPELIYELYVLVNQPFNEIATGQAFSNSISFGEPEFYNHLVNQIIIIPWIIPHYLNLIIPIIL